MKRINFRFIFLIGLMLVVGGSLITSVGYASKWEYSEDGLFTGVATVQIDSFFFAPNWENKDTVDDTTTGQKVIDNSTDLQKAINGLNDPTSEEGQALKTALEYAHTVSSGNIDYIGNVDKNTVAVSNLNKVLTVDSNCTYIIAENGNGDSFDLFITYESVDVALYIKRVSPVYKTTYTKAEDGNYYPVSTVVGSCTVGPYNLVDSDITKIQHTKTLQFTNFKAN